MAYHFCPECGGELQPRFLETENHERLVCRKCDFIFYQNPTPAAGVILFEDHKICLVKRKFAPRQGYWNLPAGFVEMNETVEAAAVREAREETNLDVRVERLYGVYSAFDSPKVHVIVVFYLAKKIGGQLQPGDDAIEARFFPLDEIPGDLAFQAHTEVIQKFIFDLKNGNL
jgi:ADP-ribose pyrophosphatase YjhB (NUDIX family)